MTSGKSLGSLTQPGMKPLRISMNWRVPCSSLTTGTGCVTMIQVTVDNRLRGRVLSLNGLIMRGVPSLGAIVMGWIADRAGLYWPLAVGAGLFLVIFLSAVRWEKRVRAIADREPGSHRGRE